MTKLAKAGALDVMRDCRDQPDSELSTNWCIERLVIAGTSESVADQILEFRDEVGAFGTLLYTGHDWTDPALHGAHGERGPAPDRSRRAWERVVDISWVRAASAWARAERGRDCHA